MPRLKKRSYCLSKRFCVGEFCNGIIASNYYHKIKTTPKPECIRLVALKYFNVNNSLIDQKNRITKLSEKCRLYFKNHQKEIDYYFETYYNGPKLNFPKQFN